MRQLDIEFFWPLTEQIPLDLDYSDCDYDKSDLLLSDGISGAYLLHTGSATTYSLVASNLNLDVDNTVICINKKPNIIRRGMYKALGLKWKKK